MSSMKRRLEKPAVEVGETQEIGMKAMRGAFGGADKPEAPQPNYQPSPEPTKDMSAMQRRAEEAKEALKKKDNLDDNLEPIKPSVDKKKKPSPFED